jgi:dCMP deaminase
MTTKWDHRFMSLAEFVASWSKDPSKKVGAVIVDKHNRLISVGYNGLPRGLADTSARLADGELKNALILHAEDNAIEQATKMRPEPGCTLYVWPASPCSDCAKRIIRAGFIECVVAPAVKETSDWKESQELAVGMLVEAGLAVEIYQ